MAPASSAAPVADILKPSCAARRCNSALTMGLTQRSRWTVVVLALFQFVARVPFGRNGFARGVWVTAAGWREAVRADAIRALSCLTEASTRFPAATFDCCEKTCLKNWGFPLLAIGITSTMTANPM